MTAAKCANREAANQTLNAIMLSLALLSVVALPRLAIDEYLAARRRSSETAAYRLEAPSRHGAGNKEVGFQREAYARATAPLSRSGVTLKTDAEDARHMA
jgi:hypothetical protein